MALFPPNSRRHFPNLFWTATATLFPTCEEKLMGSIYGSINAWAQVVYLNRFQGSHFFPIKFPDFSPDFLRFFVIFHQDISVKKNIIIFILFKCGLSDNSLCKYCLIKCNFLTVPEKRFYSLKKTFSLRLKGLKIVLKKVPWFENFFPDFGWKTHFPWFPWLKKVFKIFLNFPDRWEPCDLNNKTRDERHPLWTPLCLFTISPVLTKTYK